MPLMIDLYLLFYLFVIVIFNLHLLMLSLMILFSSMLAWILVLRIIRVSWIGLIFGVMIALLCLGLFGVLCSFGIITVGVRLVLVFSVIGVMLLLAVSITIYIY